MNHSIEKINNPFSGWFRALTGALILNLLVFGMIPLLMRKSPEKSLKQWEPSVSLHLSEAEQSLESKTVDKKEPLPFTAAPVLENQFESPKIQDLRPPELDITLDTEVADIPEPKIPLSKPVQVKPKKTQPKKKINKQVRASDKTPAAVKEKTAAKGNGAAKSAAKDSGKSSGPKNYKLGQVDSKPRPVNAPKPPYPRQAKARGIEGWVKVRFLVDSSGRVRNLQLVRAQPEGIFNAPVLNTLPGWRFSPGKIEGRPVNTWVATTIRFKMVD